MSTPSIEVLPTGTPGEWRWQIIAGDGRALVHSEGTFDDSLVAFNDAKAYRSRFMVMAELVDAYG